MMNKVLAVIFAVLFVFNAFLCVKSLVDSGKGQGALADAAFINDGTLDEANEGKLVVVTGALSTAAEAFDDITGLTLESPLAAKQTETMNEVYYDRESNNRITTPDLALPTLEFNKRYRVEDHWTPEPVEYVYGEARVGDFSLAKEILIPLLNAEKLGIETFWQDELDNSTYGYYFEGDDIFFTLSDPDHFEEGDQRISYRGVSIKDNSVYTIIGIQKGGYLERPDAAGISTWIYEGEKTSSDLQAGVSGDGVMAAMFFGVFAVLFLVLALWKFELFDKLKSTGTKPGSCGKDPLK